jgi:hypothetical protein
MLSTDKHAKGEWTKRKVDVYMPKKFAPTPNVAIFSLGALVKKVKKGKKHYACSDVATILAKISIKASVVVLENVTNAKTFNNAKSSFEWLIEQVDIPILGLFMRGKFQKPYTHVWDVVQDLYNGINIDKNLSMMCGNMAGRTRMGLYQADWSDYDRAFADNVGIAFVTERLFTGRPERKWVWTSKVIDHDTRHRYMAEGKEDDEPDLVAAIDKMAESRAYLIIVMGPPSSGKNLLSRRIQSDWEQRMGSTLVQLGEKTTEDTLDKHLDARESVLINGKFGKASPRKKLVSVAAKNGVPTLIVSMTTPKELCILLHRISVQSAILGKKSSSKVVDTYFKTFQDPHDDLYKGQVDRTRLMCINYPMVVRERPEYWMRYS